MANYQNLKAAIDQVIKANGQKEITGPVLNDTLKAIVNSLGAGYQFMGVATPATNPGTPDQNVFYIAGEAGTYTNFNSIVLPNGVSVLRWNGSWSSETVVAGDGVFDISAYKATGGTLATFADLSAALDGGNNIPLTLRKGGMSVKFVQSSDNKYVQYRLVATAWSDVVTDWQGVDDVPTAGSNNLVKSGGVAKAIPLSNDSVEGIDLAFSDLFGNAIVIFKDGNIKTKNFDSQNEGGLIVKKESEDFSLAISDEKGYALVMFKDGNIKTKNFDSKDYPHIIGYPYIGERINLQTFEFNYETYLTEVNGGQGSACYGKYLFQCFDTNSGIDIYDMTTKSRIQHISFTSVATYHCNNANFGNEFADNGDFFPLLYISQENAAEHKCLVYRITGNEGEFVATLVQTITFPEPSNDFMWYPNMMIDKERDKMIVCGLGNNPWSSGTDNTIVYKTFPLPKLSDGDVTLDINEIEDTIIIKDFPTCQGCFVRNSIAYAVFGMYNNAQLNVIDLITHKVLSRVDLSGNGLTYEPEGCFLYDGNIYVNFYNGKVFKFNF